MYANVALDSPRYAEGGGSSRQPTLRSRENFAATSVAVCQLFPRASHMEEEAKGWRDGWLYSRVLPLIRRLLRTFSLPPSSVGASNPMSCMENVIRYPFGDIGYHIMLSGTSCYLDDNSYPRNFSTLLVIESNTN